jgi:2-polyprenyl-3-methyl-5-hydroxy-6-metoxy-1,4-benzoquinol methylase
MEDEVRNHANRECREAWEENASFWDDRMGEGNDFVEVLIWPSTERLLNLQSGESVLDIACGNGLYARRLAVKGAQVVAFDFSEEMIRYAVQRTKEHSQTIEYLVMDATDESALRSLGKHKFDAAICSMALFDIVDITPLFRALGHILKEKSRFVFSIMHPCFNSPHVTLMAEQIDLEGDLVTDYSVKVKGYLSPTVMKGVAIKGQPRPQLYFHRPLQDVLAQGFEVGFVLDALEECAFPADHASGRDPLSWGGNFHEIPPVMVVRMVLKT